jgi:hypothetical protein
VVVSLDSIARAFMVEVEESSVKVLDAGRATVPSRLFDSGLSQEQLWKRAG